MICQFKSCGKCNGDLVLDGDEWRCWQCGRYYYPERPLPQLLQDPAEAKHPLTEAEDTINRKRRKSTRSVRRINSVIAARDRSDQNWWTKNQAVIAQLDQGRSVSEISQDLGWGARQVRIVRERLYELRAGETEQMAA